MRRCEIKVVIDSEYRGFDSGWPTRYIGFLLQLSKKHNLTIYAPGDTTALKEKLGMCKICNSTIVHTTNYKKNMFQLFWELIKPKRYSPIIAAPSYDLHMHSLIRSDTSKYNVSIYFGRYSYIYYGFDDKTNIIFCDFCDSIIRYKKTELKKHISIYKKISIIYDMLYSIHVKLKFISHNVNIICITDYDCQYIKHILKRNNICCIPNGIQNIVNSVGVDQLVQKYSSKYIVFVGSLDYKPNEDCLLFIIKEIWPIIVRLYPNLTFKIVGRSPTEKIKVAAQKMQNVDIIGPVENVEPYYFNAKFVLAPIFLGSGMKNKFLEALSQGTPVITTKEGAIGIDLENGIHGKIVHRKNEIIEAIQDLLSLPLEVYSDYVRNCIELAKKYHWNRIGEKLNHVITEYIDRDDKL